MRDKRSCTYGTVISIGLFACLLASAPLLDLRQVFYGDWIYRLWFIDYFGESLKHLAMPAVINTNQIVGMPVTLFYGQKFYELLGMPSAFLGATITIRIAVFMAFLLQFFQVYRASMKAGSAKQVSIGIALIMTWTIYPLTNLYNRSDHAEFFAVAFLTCSVSSLLCIILSDREHVSKYDIVAMGLFYAAAAMTHPLTAEFGGLFLFILGVTALFFCERDRRLWLLIFFSTTAILVLVVLSPWAYILYEFHDKLPVASRGAHYAFQGAGFFPFSIDKWVSRISPFPLDYRSIMQGVQDVSTPYLDAQIALPLFILMVAFVYVGFKEKSIRSCLSRCEWAIIGVSAAMLIIVFTVSIHPKVSSWFGCFFDIMDAPYRLTNYVNLTGLVILIIFAGRIGRVNADSKQIIHICLAFCIGIMSSALIEKLVHVRATSYVMKEKLAHVPAAVNKLKSVKKGPKRPSLFGPQSHLNELPPTFYWYGSFSVEDGFTKNKVSHTLPVSYQNFNVLEGDQFDRIEPIIIDILKPTLVVTNVQPFPWNQIIVDGSLRSRSDIMVAAGPKIVLPYIESPSADREAVLLTQGKHRLEYVTRTDGIWKTLDFLSWVLLVGWIAVYVVLGLGFIF